MTAQTRRERQRAERHQLIIDTAREIAETQGWDAVTVRRLADAIEYSQPVLYSHFSGKDAIVAAVAEQGFAELGELSRRLRAAADTPEKALTAVARGYLEFARTSPALYEAMFVMKVDIEFGPDAPQALRAAFGELVAVFAPFARDTDVETFTEVAWSALHGLATLDHDGRLRPDFRPQRLAVLVDQWTRR
ncbi:TetR/AcrR family transcriptional regulator [Nocardia transvalensis]|uniref:TetR/AcrR family transcriptional regulator n=1 Tax=Nocardia transvalensis TaxID=37333 RepID=UPI001894B791|nr:TetR/AcrR family transcriptional regulator [Nocardia transvalensis]MBF6327187.1 TetR/AcrR family transcriptional regulator [Nocardia transvalensis]